MPEIKLPEVPTEAIIDMLAKPSDNGEITPTPNKPERKQPRSVDPAVSRASHYS